jgi:hydroxylysine kinase
MEDGTSRGEEAAEERIHRDRALPSRAPSFSALAVMTTPAPRVSPEMARDIARGYWNIEGRATPMSGERDRNFELRAVSGPRYVLKFANPAEDPAVIDLQIRALAHIAERDPGFPVPRVVPRPNGAAEARIPRSEGGPLRARLLTWVPGIPLGRAPRSGSQRRALGRALGRLDLILRDFAHPAAYHPLVWDVAQAERLRELLPVLDPAEVRNSAAEALDEFARRAAPALPELRRQAVHNDLSPSNTLVDEGDPTRFAGLIDFGDMVETALAVDVAVGATGQLGEDSDPVDAMATFVGAFHEVLPLTAREVDLLPVLVATRFCLDLVLPAWHRKTHPDNPRYRGAGDSPEAYAADAARQVELIAAARQPATALAFQRVCGFP